MKDEVEEGRGLGDFGLAILDFGLVLRESGVRGVMRETWGVERGA
jgi:hypothetical protein